jgi:hypothetical protein
MSGPKVVRIVTREEVEAICRRHLVIVEDAAAEVRRCAKRHDALSDLLIEHLDARIQQLRRLFAEDRWIELQKQAPVTVAFLKAETQRIQAEAIAAAEAARSKRRRVADAARTIMTALEAAGVQPSPALRTISTRANLADEAELRVMEGVISENYAALTAHRNKPAASHEQLDLARRLAGDERVQSLPEWLAAQAPAAAKSGDRLDALMAEIETLDDADIVQPYRDRAVAIAAEVSPQRRSLLTDSLILDLSERSRRRRADEATMEKLRDVHAALRTLTTPETKAMEGEIASLLRSGNLEGADALMARAQAVVDAEMARLAADARRRAILGGLAKLGYEVRENMSTAWAQDGRLVVRKPNTTDYGVELGGPPDASRLQVRVVGAERPAGPRDSRRDRDTETIWCSEFTQLQQLLAEAGGEVLIERAVEAGLQPVKTIAFPETDSEVRRKAQPMQRTRPTSV